MGQSILHKHDDHDADGHLLICETCGMAAPGPRCPRCNALLIGGGCSGGCFSCKNSCDIKKPGTA